VDQRCCCSEIFEVSYFIKCGQKASLSRSNGFVFAPTISLASDTVLSTIYGIFFLVCRQYFLFSQKILCLCHKKSAFRNELIENTPLRFSH